MDPSNDAAGVAAACVDLTHGFSSGWRNMHSPELIVTSSSHSLAAADSGSSSWLPVPPLLPTPPRALEPKVCAALQPSDMLAAAAAAMPVAAGGSSSAGRPPPTVGWAGFDLPALRAQRAACLAPLKALGGLTPLSAGDAPTHAHRSAGTPPAAAGDALTRLPRRLFVERTRRAHAEGHARLPAVVAAAAADAVSAGGPSGAREASATAALESALVQHGLAPVRAESLPLAAFDDGGGEAHSGPEWVALGVASADELQGGLAGDAERCGGGAGAAATLCAPGGPALQWGVPAQGLRPSSGAVHPGAPCTGAWAPCRVVAYDGAADSFVVLWGAPAPGSSGQVGSPLPQQLPAALASLGAPAPLAPALAALSPHGHSSLPRLSVCFIAEDPGAFARRLARAHAARAAAARAASVRLLESAAPGACSLLPELAELLPAPSPPPARPCAPVNLELEQPPPPPPLEAGSGGAGGGGPPTAPTPTRPHDAPAGGDGRDPPAWGSVERPRYDFPTSRDRLRFQLLTTSPHARAALAAVHAECTRLVEGATAAFLAAPPSATGSAAAPPPTPPLFAPPNAPGCPPSPAEFAAAHARAAAAYAAHLRGCWAGGCAAGALAALRGSGQGHYDPARHADAAVYRLSRLRRLLRVGDARMRDALHDAVSAAAEGFVFRVEAACGVGGGAGGGAAGGTHGSACGGGGPLFDVDVVVVPTGGAGAAGGAAAGAAGSDAVGGARTLALSTPPADLAAFPLAALDHALASAGGVVALERRVMGALFWPADPLVPSPAPGDPDVAALRARVTAALQGAASLLEEFVRTLSRFDALLSADPRAEAAALLQRWGVTAVEAQAVTAPADLALIHDAGRCVAAHAEASRAALDALPPCVLVGCVRVSLGAARAAIAAAHADAVAAVVDAAAGALLAATGDVAAGYDAITRELETVVSGAPPGDAPPPLVCAAADLTPPLAALVGRAEAVAAACATVGGWGVAAASVERLAAAQRQVSECARRVAAAADAAAGAVAGGGGRDGDGLWALASRLRESG